MAFVDHNHASMLGTYLGCPSCNTPRFAKKGQDGRTGQEVWYLGCECPAPKGLFTMFSIRHKGTILSPKSEAIRYIATQVMRGG